MLSSKKAAAQATSVDYHRPAWLSRINRKAVGAVIHALRILEYLSTLPSPVRVTHVARELGMHLSTCFNILNTLVLQGYVQFSPRGKGYSISSQVANLARGAVDPKGALAAAQPEMRRIAQTHDLIITVWKRSAIDRMTLVAASESDAAVRLHLTVGHTIRLLLGSVGRVMATRVEMDRDELRQSFQNVRWNKPMDFDSFMLEAQTARAQGYAMDDAVANKGLLSIASPIITDSAYCDTVCCASMFVGTYPDATIKVIAHDLVGLCRLIAHIGN